MTENITDIICQSFFYAVCGFVWIQLTYEGHFLYFIRRHIENKNGHLEIYGLQKFLIHCHICLSGQIAIWIGGFYNGFFDLQHFQIIIFTLFFSFLFDRFL